MLSASSWRRWLRRGGSFATIRRNPGFVSISVTGMAKPPGVMRRRPVYATTNPAPQHGCVFLIYCWGKIELEGTPVGNFRQATTRAALSGAIHVLDKYNKVWRPAQSRTRRAGVV